MIKVSVIGAGSVGGEVARRILERDLANVVLVDILEGLPQGKALDLEQAGALEGYERSIQGTNNYPDIQDSEIAVITAGLTRKPGMSRDDLLFKNAEIIKSVVTHILKYTPSSKILMVSNPLDVMTYLAYKLSKFEANRVLGMAPLLDSARMQTFIAEELKVSKREVKAMVLGSHGDLMVPLPRHTTVSGKPLTQLLSKEKIDKIIQRTRQAGAQIVAHLKTSAYYAPSAATVAMVQAMLKDEKKIIPTCCHLKGEYGLNDVYLGVPAKLGKDGVEEIVELDLTDEEAKALHASAEKAKENIKKLGV